MPRPYSPQPKNCIVPDCTGAALTHGYCNKHWQRIRRHGHPGLVGQPHKHNCLPNIKGPRRSGNDAWQALSDESTLPEWYGRAYGCEPKRRVARRKCNVCQNHIKHNECWSADGNGYVHRWCQPHREGTYPVHFADTFQPMQLHRGAAPGHGVVV